MTMERASGNGRDGWAAFGRLRQRSAVLGLAFLGAAALAETAPAPGPTANGDAEAPKARALSSRPATRPGAPLTDEELAASWTDLNSPDTATANAAVDRLVAEGDRAAVFLAEQFRKAAPSGQETARLIAQLDADRYALRERATEALKRLGPAVEPLLRDALKNHPSPEVAARIRLVLAAFSREVGDHPLAGLYRHAIRVLTRIRSTQAVGALAAVVAAAPTREIRHRAGAALRDVAEGIIQSRVAAARAKVRAGDLHAAAALCRQALATSTEARHYRTDDLRRVLGYVLSVQKQAGPIAPARALEGLRLDPNRRVLDLGSGVKLKLVLIRRGQFLMGSPSTERGRLNDEGPRHEVTITRPFYMGIYEVTQEQYRAVMGSNPSRFKGARRPVDRVCWEDCSAFCDKLSEKTGWIARLPTEAEWEYACRAGSNTRFYYGDDESAFGEYAWHSYNSDRQTHVVGQKKPNRWGLYDMHGNVWEWCSDWYAGTYYAEAQKTDPKGPAAGTRRVFRGGCWVNWPKYCRSAGERYKEKPTFRDDGLGLRVVFSVASGAGGKRLPRRP